MGGGAMDEEVRRWAGDERELRIWFGHFMQVQF